MLVFTPHQCLNESHSVDTTFLLKSEQQAERAGELFNCCKSSGRVSRNKQVRDVDGRIFHLLFSDLFETGADEIEMRKVFHFTFGVQPERIYTYICVNSV